MIDRRGVLSSFTGSFVAVGLTALVTIGVLYNYRTFLLESLTGTSDADYVPASTSDKNLEWAEKVREGGYLLWFRHAEREKWNTVTVFDYFEVQDKLDGRAQKWSRAVCLTEKGALEAGIVGATFTSLGMDVEVVLTSPSCRARETATVAFGKIDQELIEILHPTAVAPEQQEAFATSLRTRLLSASGRKGVNVVVVGHGATLDFYQEYLFDDVEVESWDMDELGFTVIEITGERIIAHHVFQNFSDFANKLLVYEIE